MLTCDQQLDLSCRVIYMNSFAHYAGLSLYIWQAVYVEIKFTGNTSVISNEGSKIYLPTTAADEAEHVHR